MIERCGARSSPLNAPLQKLGIDSHLEKGDGYFYFSGAKTLAEARKQLEAGAVVIIADSTGLKRDQRSAREILTKRAL